MPNATIKHRKEALRLARVLHSDDKEQILEFEDIAKQLARRESIPLRDALDLMDRCWRWIMRTMRKQDHSIVTSTTWHGVELGVEGIGALTSDVEIKRCLPGAGDGGRAAAFLFASDDNHVLLIAEFDRMAKVESGVRRTNVGQLADATVQGILSDDAAVEMLKQLPRRTSLADLKRIGQEETEDA